MNLEIGNIGFESEVLKKHMVALGSTGSGKTVVCKKVIEEAVFNGIKSIIVDPQGDLSSLITTGKKVVIYTPTSSKGIPICINPLDFNTEKLDEEDKISALNLVSSSIAELIGYNLNKDKGKAAQAFLFQILRDNNFKDFLELDDFLEHLPTEYQMDIISQSEIKQLQKKIKFLTIGEKQLLFNFGVPLNIDELLKNDISVIYLNSLSNFEEKDFFISMLGNKIFQWMLKHPSDKLQFLFYIDEISSFIPAVRQTLSKDVLNLIYKQARKYGVGCIVSTQNPGDIDYKAFAQFGTWFLGRLTTKQDREKIKSSISGDNRDEVLDALPKMEKGTFYVFSPDQYEKIELMKVNWLKSEHKTMTLNEVKVEMDKIRQKFDVVIKKQENKVESVHKDIKKINKHFKIKVNIEDITNKKKKRKFLLFGDKVETLISKKIIFSPVLKVKVRRLESKFFKKKLEDYTIYFKKGVIMKDYDVSKLLELNEQDLKHLRLLIKNKEKMSTKEISERMDMESLRILKSLQAMNLIGYSKEGKKFLWYDLTGLEFKDLRKFNFKMDTEEVLVPDLISKYDYKVDQFLRGFYDCEIIEEETIYYPYLEVKYKHDKKETVRKVKIDLVTGEVL